MAVADRLIRIIAQREGIKEDEVQREMEKAILAGYLNPKTNAKWNMVFGVGNVPTPEEFIIKMAKIAAK